MLPAILPSFLTWSLADELSYLIPWKGGDIMGGILTAVIAAAAEIAIAAISSNSNDW